MSWSDDRAVDAVHWQILKNHLKPNIWTSCREMLKYKQELDAARHTDLNQLASSVQEMKNKLSYLKKTASDVNKIKTVGFENFRRDIKTFESKLTRLKEGGSKKLREECARQVGLLEEIEQIKKLALHNDVSKPQGGGIGKKKDILTVKRVPISKNSYSSKEVADFHEFCARNYGLTGGWSSKDHETFLKIRSRSSDGGNFIDHIVQTMPRNVVVHEYFSFQRPVDISVEAAREHERWFVKFEELRARQKEAITKWKNEKKNISLPNFNVACSNNVEKKFSDYNEKNAKVVNDRLEKEENENHNVSESQCEVVESEKLSNCDKMLLKRFREKDKKFIESKKSNKQRIVSERISDPITVVTLHGKSEPKDIETLEKLPNVHFSIYGAHNQDVKVVLKYQ